MRVLVDPAEAHVYVDGDSAGIVDDFDGLFQRLHVRPGCHEIALELEGYKTVRLMVDVPPWGTFKLDYDMQKGSGELFENLGGSCPDRRLQPDREPTLEQETAGRLLLDVTPSDASVYIDGAFRGAAREAATLQLPPGRHQIEVVRPGYQAAERQVDLATGGPTAIAIALRRDEPGT